MGARLRQIRRGKGITVTALAHRLGIERTTIQGYESGYRVLRPVVVALLLVALDERPDPAIWPPLVCKLANSLNLDELHALRGTRSRTVRGAA